MPDSQDGRHQRGAASRQRIVDALMHLVREGHVMPSAERVAAHAEVGLRTVFRHFKDMDSLFEEIAQGMEAWLLPVLTAPYASSDWREQLAELIERRTQLYEELMPFKIAADVQRYRSPYLREDRCRVVRMERRSLHKLLPEALHDDAPRFEALDALLSFDAWQRMRKDQQLSVADARHSLQTAARLIIQ